MELLLTTVCRTAPPDSVHGQLIRCNTEQGRYEVVIELKGSFCNMNPRGGDRGFRGIAYDTQTNRYLITAANAVHIFNTDFQSIGTVTHPSFRHLHNIEISGRTAFIVSTGADRIVELNLDNLKITDSWLINQNSIEGAGMMVKSENNPPESRGPWVNHFNALQTFSGGFYVSGARSEAIVKVHNNTIEPVQKLPLGTHDILMQNHQLTYLNTAANCITTAHMCGKQTHAPIKQYSKYDDTVHFRSGARANFLRGLCHLPEIDSIAFGSSPTSVGLYHLGTHSINKIINISRDVRWMVSGLCVMPCDN